MAKAPALMAKAKPKLSFDERLANLAKTSPQLPAELLHQALNKHDGHVGHACAVMCPPTVREAAPVAL